jgi:hypothetical protein
MSGYFTQVNKWLHQEKCTGATVFISRFVHMANVTRPTNHSLNFSFSSSSFSFFSTPSPPYSFNKRNLTSRRIKLQGPEADDFRASVSTIVRKRFRLQEQKDIENVRNTLQKHHCLITFLIVTFTNKQQSFWLKTKLNEERVYKQNM